MGHGAFVGTERKERRHHARHRENAEKLARRGVDRGRDGGLLFCDAVGAAQVSRYDEKQMAPVSDKPPAILNKVGIAQRLNEQLPLALTFTDDAGQQVQLASYFGKKPAILALVYYQCPMLCSEELNGLTSALQMVSFVPARTSA
jgi:protein SCO1/2